MKGLRGFTIVEIMVGLVLGLLLGAGLLQIYLSTKQTYRTNEALSDLMENGYLAFHVLSSDLWMTGYTGCSKETDITNTLNGAQAAWELDLATPLRGYDYKDSTFPDNFASDVQEGTDAFVTLHGSFSETYHVKAHDADNGVFELFNPHALSKGAIVMVTDCKHTALFQVTNVPDNTHLAYGTGGNLTPGNCSDLLGGGPYCGGNFEKYTFKSNAVVMPLIARAYFIHKSDGSGPVRLQREVLFIRNDGKASTRSEPLVDDVEDMQVLYLEGGTYRTAAEVTDWSAITQVLVRLLLKSPTGNLPEARTFTYQGDDDTEPVTFKDRHIRHLMEQVFTLRNRL